MGSRGATVSLKLLSSYCRNKFVCTPMFEEYQSVTRKHMNRFSPCCWRTLSSRSSLHSHLPGFPIFHNINNL
ncbi:hypothetical protein VIGAN_04368600, partial [Vigna angularis var. angularis]